MGRLSQLAAAARAFGSHEGLFWRDRFFRCRLRLGGAGHGGCAGFVGIVAQPLVELFNGERFFIAQQAVQFFRSRCCLPASNAKGAIDLIRNVQFFRSRCCC